MLEQSSATGMRVLCMWHLSMQEAMRNTIILRCENRPFSHVADKIGTNLRNSTAVVDLYSPDQEQPSKLG
jgi:hypothetical protein